MNREERIQVAQETLSMILNQQYDKNGKCIKIPDTRKCILLSVDDDVKSTQYEVLNESVIKTIMDNENKHPFVLNFASAHHPGGGFFNGSIAQEETLCYCSTLYDTIKESEMYSINKASSNPFYENIGLYSPDVYLFRDDNFELLDNLVHFSVFSMPAVNLKKIKNLDKQKVESVMKLRINTVLKYAKYFNHQTLILGAWGCGVFGNSPEMIAALFKEELEQFHFETVIFSIKTNDNQIIEPFFNLLK